MSNALAIAATTAALQSLLKDATAGVGGQVTGKPLASARGALKGPQLNLCLYHAAIDAGLRNNPDALHRPPGRSPDGALILPLPLNLAVS